MADVIFPDTRESLLPFSPAVIVGDLVFISGQASVSAEGQIIDGSFEEEMHRAMENLRGVLSGCKLDLSAVVQTRNYVRDAENLPLFNQIYRQYFKPPYPARTSLSNCLGRLKFEIDAIAVIRR